MTHPVMDLSQRDFEALFDKLRGMVRELHELSLTERPRHPHTTAFRRSIMALLEPYDDGREFSSIVNLGRILMSMQLRRRDRRKGDLLVSLDRAMRGLDDARRELQAVRDQEFGRMAERAAPHAEQWARAVAAKMAASPRMTMADACRHVAREWRDEDGKRRNPRTIANAVGPLLKDHT